MAGLNLVAVGSALPRTVVTNRDLSERVDTSDEWITSRTGIKQRYFCTQGETATTLAIAAAQDVLANSEVQPCDIGCIICATLSNDTATPSMACKVQAAIGAAEDIPALDLNAACSGFLYGVAVADGLLRFSHRKYALVIGCEQLSRLLDMTDRNTCVLFGDGAGAALLRQEQTADFAVCMGARGDDAIYCKGAGHADAFIQMDGRAVFRFAVEAVPKTIQQILSDTALTLEEIDWVVCHQANERIIDHCVKKLKANPEQFYKNMSRYGNTSAASIPMALAEMQANGLLQSGQRVLCVGFGGGLSWAGALLSVKGV
ncbi:MAG: beta-ketoacyl-ACP synthase III [Faecalibacterium sp.]